MITIKEYVAPAEIKEAYEILVSKKKNVILGGCGFIKMGSANINTAIDLCNLSLDYIKEEENEIFIGADTLLRDLEINEIIKKYCNGVISEAVSNIVGVQFRNIARVGASVFSKYGFSDLIPALLVLDAKVKLYNGGLIELERFLESKHQKDILVEVVLPKKRGQAVFNSIRKSSTDFAILNGAMFKGEDNNCKIAIGARPGRAKLAVKAASLLEKKEINSEQDILLAAEIASEELSFGTNLRGSKEYRKDMCKVLVKRMNKKLGDHHD